MIKRKTLAIIMAISIIFSLKVNTIFGVDDSNIETPVNVISETENTEPLDTTPPNIEVINPISDNYVMVSGKTEPGINVTVQIDKDEYKGITDKNGRFNISIKTKRKAGTMARVIIKDLAGNISYKDMTVIAKLETRKANRNISLVSGRKKVTIPKGTSITVQDLVGDKCLVTYKGITGYINSRYLQSGLDYSKFNSNIDAFVNENNIKSDTKYMVVTSLQKKETYVFQGSVGNWKRINTWKCTIGKPSSPTITGEYEVGTRGRSFGQDKGYQCKWFTQISGNYLYHSIVYNKAGTRITDGRLGSSLSKGCIRLATENAKWIYDNVSKNTKVIIK